MMVETVALNPKLDDALFGKPDPAVLPAKRVFTVAATGDRPNPPAAAQVSPAK
jgi:hypothetical protein